MGFFNILKSNKKSSINNSVVPECIMVDLDMSKAVFLWWSNGKKLNADYPQYLKFRYGITNPSAYHKQLIRGGYFNKPTFNDVIAHYKLDNLKELCENNGLSSSGNKKALIDRLSESLTDSIKDGILDSSSIYVLSDLGNEYLNQNYDYVEYHKQTYGIGIEEYLKYRKRLKEKNPKYTFNDIVWAILNKHCVSIKSTWDLQKVSYAHLMKHHLLLSESRKEQALTELIFSILYDAAYRH